MNLPMVNIYKFCKKEILIQPPGEPRKQHLSDVRPKKFELHKIKRRQNYWKGRYTLAHFWENYKKVKMKSEERKTLFLVYFLKMFNKFTFFWVLWLQFKFFCSFLKTGAFWKKFKKVKNEVTGTEKHRFG